MQFSLQGGPNSRWLWLSSCVCVLAATGTFFVAAAFGRGCGSGKDLAECPSLCRDRCLNDAEFKAEFPQQCVDALSGAAKDQSNCTAASAPDNDYISDLLSSAAFPSCTPNFPALVAQYARIDQELTKSLEVYRPILEGDYDKTETADALCAYTFNEIVEAVLLATQNKDALERLKEEIESANACAEEVDRWQQGLVVRGDGGSPAGDSAQDTAEGGAQGSVAMENLRRDLIAQTQKSNEAVEDARLRLRRTTADIEGAVPTLKFLLTVHNFNCPKVPAQSPLPGGQ